MIWLLVILFIPGGLNQVNVYSDDMRILWFVCGKDVRVWYDIYENKQNETTGRRSNEYELIIAILADTVTLQLKFSSEVFLKFEDSIEAKVTPHIIAKQKNSFGFIFSGNFDAFGLKLEVLGPDSGDVPYVESVLRDYQELCPKVIPGYLDQIIKEGATNALGPIVDKSCGRRKVIETQLIVHGQSTAPGDWPWHVAIIRLEKSSLQYICGGTLLSKTLVLTAAHCASIRGDAVVPDILSVHLGKHDLIGRDIGAQEREVFQVIIHPKFDGFTQDNDIALLKLKSEAVITDYVQPACLWYKNAINKLPDSQSLFGTVAGWGFDHRDSLFSTLQKTTIPIIPEVTCLKSHPTFFQQRLNDNKFCAGFANGTSVCNGDSGGGLMIFVPDSSGDTDMASGGWYVRGIVSIAIRKTDKLICDPYKYAIFTDVEKYRDWLLEYMK